MAESDLLLRPKVDQASLKTSSKKMERSYIKAFNSAAKASARFTQKALTTAMKGAAKAGGSAFHSAFQVGLGAIVDNVKSLIEDIDETVDRTKNRAQEIANTVSRAQAFNMTGAELFTLETAAQSVGLDETAVQGFLEGFKDALIDAEKFGDRYRKAQEEEGTFKALMLFMQREVYGKDAKHAQEALAAAGQTGSGQTELLRVLAATGGQSMEDLSVRLLGMTQSQIGELLGKNETVQAQFLKQQLKERKNDLFRAGGSMGNAGTINALDNAQMNLRNQQEQALADSARFRLQMMELQQEVNKITIQAMNHFEKVLTAYEQGGFTAALSEAIAPIAEALSGAMSGLKQDIKEAISESIPAWMQTTTKANNEKKSQDVKPQSAARGVRG